MTWQGFYGDGAAATNSAPAMNDARTHGGAQPSAPGCACLRAVGSPLSGYLVQARRPRPQMTTIMEMRSFDFSNIKTRNDVYVVLCPAFAVLAYTRVRLSIRVHALTMSAGQTLRFYVWNTLPSDEDPAQEFVESSPLTTADITSATSAPALVTGATGYDPVAYLKISVRAVQAPTAALTLRATLSACLLLRTG